jgi:hypothetical protein
VDLRTKWQFAPDAVDILKLFMLGSQMKIKELRLESFNLISAANSVCFSGNGAYFDEIETLRVNLKSTPQHAQLYPFIREVSYRSKFVALCN